MPTAVPTAALDAVQLLDRYAAVRRATERLCEPLSAEDLVVQSMPDASPAKWHLAHTTWFFETFVLSDPALAGYEPFDPRFNYLFNSYYESVGPRHPRPRRGLLTRPSAAEVYAYRAHVDAALAERLPRLDGEEWERLRPVIELGINHEQQHQELIFTDIKHAFAQNPLQPAYAALPDSPAGSAPPMQWLEFDAGVRQI